MTVCFKHRNGMYRATGVATPFALGGRDFPTGAWVVKPPVGYAYALTQDEFQAQFADATEIRRVAFDKKTKQWA